MRKINIAIAALALLATMAGCGMCDCGKQKLDKYIGWQIIEMVNRNNTYKLTLIKGDETKQIYTYEYYYKKYVTGQVITAEGDSALEEQASDEPAPQQETPESPAPESTTE